MPGDWEKYEFAAKCYASGKGHVGKNRDKTRKTTQEELGNRKRTEVIYRRLNTVEPRQEILKIYDKYYSDQVSLDGLR